MITYTRHFVLGHDVKQDSVFDLDDLLKKSAEREVIDLGKTPLASSIQWIEAPEMLSEDLSLPHVWIAMVLVAVAS